MENKLQEERWRMEGVRRRGRCPAERRYGFIPVNRTPCHVFACPWAKIYQMYNPSSAAEIAIDAAAAGGCWPRYCPFVGGNQVIPEDKATRRQWSCC